MKFGQVPLSQGRFLLNHALQTALPALVIGSLMLGYYLYLQDRQDHLLMTTRMIHHVAALKDRVQEKLRFVTSDLRFLRDHHQVRLFPATHSVAQLARDLTAFSRHRGIYDRIRLLDLQGREQLRVDYHKSRARTVPARFLGNMADQPAFREGVKLPPGYLFQSRFALHRQGQQVTRPHKPLIRFSAPLHDRKKRMVGLLMLDYLGGQLLDRFRRTGHEMPEAHAWLLNAEGFWLSSHRPRDAWGFMLPERGDRYLYGEFPLAWQRINQRASGHILTDEGLFAFDTIQPEMLHDDRGALKLEHADPYWKVVAFLPRDRYEAMGRQRWRSIMPTILMALGLLVILSLLMAKRAYSSYLDEASLRRQNLIYRRFAPHAFLTLLKSGRLHTIAPGDHTQRHMAVLISDMRPLARSADSVPPDQVVAQINDFFRVIAPIITEERGIILTYASDVILALFPGGAGEAARAIIGIRGALTPFNRQRRGSGQAALTPDFGIHYGPVVFGVVGSQERMDPIAFGETVDITTRIEAACRYYRVTALISGEVAAKLPKGMLCRHIDTVRIPERLAPVMLYELFEIDPPERRACKKATQARYAQALEDYRAHRFQAALEGFSACCRDCPEDPLPPLFIKRCKALLKTPPNPDWQGVSSFVNYD